MGEADALSLLYLFRQISQLQSETDEEEGQRREG